MRPCIEPWHGVANMAHMGTQCPYTAFVLVRRTLSSWEANMADVPSGTEPQPGAFARAVSDEVRLAMTRHRTTSAKVAEKIGRSASYMSKRMRNEASLTVNDVAEICRVLGEDLEELLAAAARASRRI